MTSSMNEKRVESNNMLMCSCSKCLIEPIPEHQHEIKDYHPEIKWKTSKAQKNQEIRDIMKSYGTTYEKALKIYNGDVKQ